MAKLVDMTGQQFESLTVLHKAERLNSSEGTQWVCLCSCGALTKCARKHLISGRRVSCGCRPRHGKDNPNWKGGQYVRGSEAQMNISVRRSLKSARECGHHEITLTGKELSALYSLHSKTCDFCGVSESKCTRPLAVDHCHKTGRFRGFLCDRCNLNIGQLGDTIESAHKLVNYLTPLPSLKV